MEPILLDVPDEIVTERLLLRVPRAGDSDLIFPAVLESLAELSPWMKWVYPQAEKAKIEEWARKCAAGFVLRNEFLFSLYLPGTQTCLGSCGLFRVNWDVPWMEIGYWLRTPYCGKGLMAEAVNAVTAYAFEHLKAERVELRCDDRNVRSAAVATRCGYALEGTLHNDSRTPQGMLRSTRIYAKLRAPLT
jgi:ribosomal-protein-serine acetyltransferase